MAKLTVELGDHLELNSEATLRGIRSAISRALVDQKKVTVNVLRDLILDDIDIVTVDIPEIIPDGEVTSVVTAVARLPGVVRVQRDSLTVAGAGRPYPAEPRATPEQKAVISRELNDLRNKITKNATTFDRFATQLQFIDENYSPTAGALSFAITLSITDSNGIKIPYTKTASVTLDITGGTASNAKLTLGISESAIGGSLVVKLTDGTTPVTVTATSTGTVILGLIDTSGLGFDMTDTATVTFS